MTTVLTCDPGLPFAACVADALPTGALAGPWRVEHELGRGGMGAVYAVIHDGIGKRAALKVVHRELVSAPGSAARVLLEAKVVNQIRHPHIIDIFDTGELADGRPFIVMERLEGAALSELVQRGKLRADQVIAILLQICDALGAAHAAGVVHRDLKLDNVFVASDGTVKVLDWGIAKVVSTDVRQTVEGMLVGTPQYLSPEQARGAAVTAQTDVYSLGVVAYELFLEQLPFEAETAAEILVMHLRSTPPPPRDAWPDIPPALDRLLLAMLAKHPDDRPTMAGVAQSLSAIQLELEVRRGVRAPTGEPIALTRSGITRRPSAAELAETHHADTATIRSRRRWRWPVAIATATAILGIAGFAMRQGADPPAAAAVVPMPVPAPMPPPAPTPAPTPVLTVPSAPTAVAVTPALAHTPPRATSKRPARKLPAAHVAAPHKRGDLDGTVDPYPR